MKPDAAPDPRRFAVERADPRGFAQAFVREGRGGRPLLLVHGEVETKRIWWRTVAPLAEAGFEVIAPDLRGFGESAEGGAGARGSGGIAMHARDVHALVRDILAHARVIAVGSGAGAAIAQDLSLRFPGFVERLVLLGGPLPVCAASESEPREPAIDAGAADADALAADLATPERRRGFFAAVYTAPGRTHPGALDRDAVAFLCEPFSEAETVRASFALRASGSDPGSGAEPALLRRNPTRALLLLGASDRGVAAGFDRRAARAFPDRVGPLRVPRAGRFVAWEAADAFVGAIRGLCRDAPRPADWDRRACTAYVSLGSNLGEREVALTSAVAALRATRGIRDVVVSPVYETDPVGPGEQGPYLNAALRLETALPPDALLDRLLAIERAAGRTRSGVRNEARVLDLDLLLYGDRVIDAARLHVPHPRLAERAFVLEPLCTLAPDLVHPTLGRTLSELLAAVRDPAAVRRRDATV